MPTKKFLQCPAKFWTDTFKATTWAANSCVPGVALPRSSFLGKMAICFVSASLATLPPC